MGSDESHFNVSLIARDKVTRQCPETTIFWRERRTEADSNRGPSAYQPNALPLGQTGSHLVSTAPRLKNQSDSLPTDLFLPRFHVAHMIARYFGCGRCVVSKRQAAVTDGGSRGSGPCQCIAPRPSWSSGWVVCSWKAMPPTAVPL